MKLDLRTAAVLAAAAFATAAGADNSPYYLGGYVGYTRMSNLFGLQEGKQPSVLFPSRDDNVTTLALIAGVDQPISRQRVFGDLTVSRNKFSENQRLDNTSYTLTAGLDWETVGNLSGEVVAKANRELQRYTAYEQPTDVRNLVTTRQVDAVGRLGGVTRLSFELGGGWRSVGFSDPAYDSRESRVSYGTIGLRWLPSGASSFGIAYRDTNGRYPTYRVNAATIQPDRFDRRDVDLNAKLELSGLTTLSARLSSTKIDYELQDLDFTGYTGFVRATWLPGAKLKLLGEIARDRGADLEIPVGSASFVQTGSARLVTLARLRADYALSAKVSLNAGTTYSRRPVVATSFVPPFFTVSEDGRLRTTQYSLGAAWTPTRTSRIGCTWTKEKQRSELQTAPDLDVSTGTFGCYAQLTIEP